MFVIVMSMYLIESDDSPNQSFNCSFSPTEDYGA